MTGSLQIRLVLFFIFSHYTFHESGGKFHKAIKHLLHDNSKSSLRDRRLSNIERAVLGNARGARSSREEQSSCLSRFQTPRARPILLKRLLRRLQ